VGKLAEFARALSLSPYFPHQTTGRIEHTNLRRPAVGDNDGSIPEPCRVDDSVELECGISLADAYLK
jgi:hypothetical protein